LLSNDEHLAIVNLPHAPVSAAGTRYGAPRTP